MIRHSVCSSSKNQSPAVSQQSVDSMAAEAAGRIANHPDKSTLKEALVESVLNMVYMKCGEYTTSCNQDVEDLAQDCFLRILKSISKFNPRLGRFTTWCWYTCKSQLNSEYRRQLIVRSRFTSDYVINDNSMTVGPASTLSLDITEVVRELAVKYPTKKRIIYTMFGGNPDEDKELMLPSRIKCAEIAEKLDMEYMTVYTFYKNKVRPLFIERFS